jgi:D-beta-D-heptose 7-phosphate kinase/D-beta-D-heptose 1-phosphate adenosyltransferase
MVDSSISRQINNASNVLPWDQQRPTLAVLGDAILDEYLQGDVNRISPEAPVPVHLVKATILRPGGAANAALNIQTVGAQAKLFSVVGNDDAGIKLRELLRDAGIDDSAVLNLSDRPTTRKTRVTAGIQQLIRVDWEKQLDISVETVEALLEKLESSSWDGLLISDYGKGLLSDALLNGAISIAKNRNVPIIVDPKRKDFSCYNRATVITPNRKEATLAIDLESDSEISGEEIGRILHEKFKFEHVLVTLGPKGMVLVNKSSDPGGSGRSLSLKALAREVYDVSGAGDTVAAIMAVGLGCGAPIEDVVKLANTAAAIVVGKVGTQPVYRNELISSLTDFSKKKVSQRKVLNILEIPDFFKKQELNLSKRKLKMVFTNGCFDILHAGHVTYLEKARERGDLLIVGVNSDESVKRLKGPSRPIVTLKDRVKVLAALECVDYVVPFDQDTPEELIKLLSPNVLVKGGDYKVDADPREKNGIIGSDFVRSIGGQVVSEPLVPGLSTTEIIKKACAELR